jgi:hypothetical protein
MSVRFTLEKRTNKYGESPIRLSWSFGGRRYQSTLGFSINKANWDDVKKLVKIGTHNLKGQKAEDINFIIKRISLVVTGIEQHFNGNEKALTKDMMKKAVIDVLSHDFARPEDIMERCIEGIVSIARPEIQYYRDFQNRYYRSLCDANYANIKFKILQQLFGRGERIAVPSTDFKPRKIEGIKSHVLFYREVSCEEVFGKKSR